MVFEKEAAGVVIYFIFVLVPEILFLIFFESVGNGLKFRLSFKHLNPFVSKLTAGVVMLGIIFVTPLIEHFTGSPIKTWLMTFSIWKLLAFAIFVCGFTLAFIVYNGLGKKLKLDKTMLVISILTILPLIIFLLL